MNFARKYIEPFWHFTAFTPTIPKLYWNVRSQEQRILNLFELLNKIICYADYLGKDLNELAEILDEIEQKLDDPEFYEQYLELLQQWLDEHMPEIIGRAAQMVFFGLTDDGYFVAYIPTGYAWDDIVFDTGMVYGTDEYGRLILLYDVENAEHNVNQGLITDRQMLNRCVNDITEIQTTLYAPMSEGGMH